MLTTKSWGRHCHKPLPCRVKCQEKQEDSLSTGVTGAENFRFVTFWAVRAGGARRIDRLADAGRRRASYAGGTLAMRMRNYISRVQVGGSCRARAPTRPAP